MINRFMRILVFFDLPVQTKNQRRIATRFRKDLIKQGFVMIQYSVYSRTVRNHDDAKKYIGRISAAVPREGSVRVLKVTEKQYASMLLLAGERLKKESLLDTKELLEL